MSTTLSSDLRCPQCGAHLPAVADWCSLCYADLRPTPAPPEVEAVDEVEVGAPPEVTESEVAPSPSAAAPRGKHARREAASEPKPGAADGGDGIAVDDDEKSRVADALLAELAAQSDKSLSRYSSFIDTPGKKAAFIIGGAVSAMAVLLALMGVAGILL